jgi:spermidine/putrescine transport system substrate-binding protein
MKKAFIAVAATVLCVLIFTGCGKTGGGTLNLYTWEGMFPDEMMEDFTKQTGININYSDFDTDETMLTKLQANGGGEYDLVIADDYIIEIAITEQLAQKLDKSKISTFGNINPLYQKQFYDLADEYTVPYGAGVQTIMYSPDRVSIPITGYADLWDPSLKDQVGTIANYRVVNGMALKVNGKSYNTNDLGDIRDAGDLLLKLAPNIRLIKDDNIQDDLVTGEINAAVMYTSQVTMAKFADPTLEIVFPKEGIGFGIMAGFIPVKAPNAASAHKFLEYLLKPEVSAQCFEWLGYYCTTAAADGLISEEMKSFLTLPAGFDGRNMEMIENVGLDALDLHDSIWTEFKIACGQ